jgi:uncharacterized protein (DUF1499 family)
MALKPSKPGRQAPAPRSFSKGTSMMVWLILIPLLLVVAGLAAGRLGLLQGSAPVDLGVKDGRLKRPSKTPNSVSSQADLWPGDKQQDYARIAPLALINEGGVASGPATLARIEALISTLPGAEIVKREPGYLYATFTTALMKYTDDVEFWFDPAAGVVQVRSASRLGNSDLGANRARVEAIRKLLAGG